MERKVRGKVYVSFISNELEELLDDTMSIEDAEREAAQTWREAIENLVDEYSNFTLNVVVNLEEVEDDS